MGEKSAQYEFGEFWFCIKMRSSLFVRCASFFFCEIGISKIGVSLLSIKSLLSDLVLYEHKICI